MHNIRSILQYFINLWSAGHLRDSNGIMLPGKEIEAAREIIKYPHAHRVGDDYVDVTSSQELDAEVRERYTGEGPVPVETWYRGDTRYATVDENGKVTYERS